MFYLQLPEFDILGFSSCSYLSQCFKELFASGQCYLTLLNAQCILKVSFLFKVMFWKLDIQKLGSPAPKQFNLASRNNCDERARLPPIHGPSVTCGLSLLLGTYSSSHFLSNKVFSW